MYNSCLWIKGQTILDKLDNLLHVSGKLKIVEIAEFASLALGAEGRWFDSDIIILIAAGQDNLDHVDSGIGVIGDHG